MPGAIMRQTRTGPGHKIRTDVANSQLIVTLPICKNKEPRRPIPVQRRRASGLPLPSFRHNSTRMIVLKAAIQTSQRKEAMEARNHAATILHARSA